MRVHSATLGTRTSQGETAAGTWTKMEGMKVLAFIPFISEQMLFKRRHRVGLRARGS
jgi:hypothetical protein